MTVLKRLNAAMSPAAMLVAIFALLVAAGGAGYAAAGQIGTSGIKNNAITAKKIHKNAVTSKKIKAGAVDGSKIADGTVGRSDLTPAADKLVQGAPWATLPSGVTVTGHFYDHGKSSGTSAVYNFDLPGYAPVNLAGDHVNFAPDIYPGSTDDDPACTGTYDNPTAPAGKVCIYLGSLSGITSMIGQTWASPAHRNQAFYIEGGATDGGAFGLWGVWAYTAP
ncbi:MAG TPA: hypothetical protein VNS81_08880 [Nocardioides sp.]|nr:hypothetical protein [Nocardioides sp.]